MNRLIVVCAIALLAAGCAIGGFDDYREPPGGSVATLYIDGEDRVDMGLYSDEDCKVGKHGTFINNALSRKKTETTTAVPLAKGYFRTDGVQADIRSIKIPAGEKVFVTYNFFDNKSRCYLTLSFTPRDGGNYFSTVPMFCRAGIIDLDATREMKNPVRPADLARNKKSCRLYSHTPL
jgi:hypothetical protein